MRRSVFRPSPIFVGILAITIAGGIFAAVSSQDIRGVAATVGVVLIVLGGWTLSLCLHEFGHAYVAYRGGDYSVRAKGYLNLDPRHYTDPILSLLLPLLFVILGGIPLPGGAVWIDHHALRDRRVESLVSLVGPLVNLVFGALLAIAVAVFHPPIVLAAAMTYLALLQMIAFVLNILPIPGFDGYGALEPYLSPQAKRFGEQARPWAPIVVFAILFTSATISGILSYVGKWLLVLFYGSPFLADGGNVLFHFWQR